jgi:hypothetical protein
VGHEGDLAGAGDGPAHAPDRGDDLGDGVLGRDGVVEQRRVQCPAGLARRTPVASITERTASKIRSGRPELRSLERQ